MSESIKIKRGLNIPIKGEASREVSKDVFSEIVAIKPTDFRGVVPRLLVDEGDVVKAGSPLFCDKNNQSVFFTSPVSGVVEQVVRGEKRKLLAVRVKADREISYEKFDVPANPGREQVTDLMMKSGLWPALIQRPYGVTADAGKAPKAIFISGFNTAPMAADLEFTLKDEFANIQKGIEVLGKLTDGGVHLSLCKSNCADTGFHKLKGAVIHIFEGPHPAGNVGVQINRISPIAKGQTVWTVDFVHVAMIGRLFNNGIYDARKTVAVTGPAAKNPSYVRCVSGMQMSCIAEYADASKGELRIVSGDVLTGQAVGPDGFLGFFDDQVSILAEGHYYEMFGWCKPLRLKKFTFSRTYPSFLCTKKRYEMDTNENGGQRAFLMNDVYRKVFPMDIYALQLFKACLAGDIDRMEQLGIYEVLEEDVALCEYVCPSKVDIQEIVRKGFDTMLKEMA